MAAAATVVLIGAIALPLLSRGGRPPRGGGDRALPSRGPAGRGHELARAAFEDGMRAMLRADGVDDAVRAFEAALEIDPGFDAARRRLVTARCTRAREQQNLDPEGAWQSLERARALDPDDPAVRATDREIRPWFEERLVRTIGLVEPQDDAVLGDRALRVAGRLTSNLAVAIEVALVEGVDGRALPFPDGAARAAAIAGGRFEADLVAPRDGRYWIRVQARDANGIVAELRPLAVQIDTEAPVLYWESPADSFVPTGPLVIRGNVRDEGGTCEVRVNDVLAEVENGRWTATVEISAGQQQVFVRARDPVGNATEPLVRVLEGSERQLDLSWAIPDYASGEIDCDGLVFPRTVIDRVTGIRMVLIAPGEFSMGSPESEEGRRPDEVLHVRRIREPFWIGESEVSRNEWNAIMGLPAVRSRDHEDPVAEVGWQECVEFCRRLNGGADGPFRLPTEAEWEYACRGGTVGRFSVDAAPEVGDWLVFDRDPDGEDIWKQFASPVPAGIGLANPKGLRQIHGNVMEWCQDVFLPYPTEGTEEAARSAGPAGDDTLRVVRGGAFDTPLADCRSAARRGVSAGTRARNIGFRLVRSAR